MLAEIVVEANMRLTDLKQFILVIFYILASSKQM